MSSRPPTRRSTPVGTAACALILLVGGAAGAPARHTEGVHAPEAPTEEVPFARAAVAPGLPADLMGAVQEARHRVAREHEGADYLAASYSQELRLRFAADGVVVTPRQEVRGGWALRLRTVSWGRPGAVRPAERGERWAEGRRLEYRRAGFTEWFVNHPGRGVEHGYTVDSRPPGEGPLRIELALEGLVAETLGEDAVGLREVGAGVGRVVRYEGLVVRDAAGAEVPARLEVVAEGAGVAIAVDDAAAVYPLVVDPMFVSEEGQLQREGPEAGAEAGFDVALSGDTAVVGAYRDDTAAGLDAGAAYVLVRSGTSWSEQAILLPSAGAAGDGFGVSVALSGDTALVGGIWADTAAGEDAGSAWVFVRSGASWSEQAQLLPSTGAASDYFGGSVALADDTAVVSAYFSDTAAGTDAGSAWVFVRSEESWSEQAQLVRSGGVAGDFFGNAVAISGDTAVVGHLADDTEAGVNAGSAWVFVRSGTSWSEEAQLLPSEATGGDLFGLSVALSGDTAVVGAPKDHTGGMDAGSAWVFVRSGTSWSEQAQLLPSESATGDNFGHSVALSGDTAVVGAFVDDTVAGTDAGSAWVFVRSGTSWSEEAQLLPSTGTAGDRFGLGVAISGDTALVGAYLDNTATGTDAGSATVFVRSGASWSEQAILLQTAGATGDSFGISVALSGDTAVVGAYADDTDAGTNAGSAWVFVRSGVLWREQARLLPSAGAASDLFGISVALSGDTAVVGAAYADDTVAGADVGSAWVFVRSGTTWSEQARLLPSTGEAGDLFGYSVALSGDTAVAGAWADDTAAGTDAGSAWVFVRSGTTWSEQAQLLPSDGAGDDYFGQAVALWGDTAVVGAYGDDTAAGANAGSAWVFARSGTEWSEQAQLLPSEGAALDFFGLSVALSGDTAVVGAQGDDTAGENAGSAWVFVRSGTVWSEQAQLLASAGAAGDLFGRSAAVWGDTAVVGGSGDDTDAGTNAGSAQVFVRSGTVWSEQAQLLPGAAAAEDHFGVAVALSGDTAVVGAHLDDTAAGTNAGSAWVFRLQAPGVTVTPTSALVTTEAGGTDTFTVVLTTEPSGDVVVDVAADDPGEATAAPAQLTFTGGPSGDWATPQTVTLTGVDDLVDDGDQGYTVGVTVAAGATTDAEYQAIDPADVTASNADDDDAGVLVSPTSGLITTEAGGSDTFTVVLTSEPVGDVVIDAVSDDLGEGVASPAQLTFTGGPDGDWATPRTVTLTGVDDLVADGDQEYTVALAVDQAATADPLYDGLDPADVAAINRDDAFEGSYYTVTPCRLLDTRQPDQGPALASGALRGIAVHGNCGIPATARAVALNVTVTQPSGLGHLTIYPGDQLPGSTSTLNFSASQTRANNTVVGLAAGGSGTLGAQAVVTGQGSVHLILDVTGYFE